MFHVLGLKCQQCGSYNTCRTQEPEGANGSESMPPEASSSTTQDTVETAMNEETEIDPSATPNSSSSATNLNELVNDLDITEAPMGNVQSNS